MLWNELENGSISERAALERRAIEISIAIEGETRLRQYPVWRVKTMEDFFYASWGHFENGTAVVGAPVVGRAVEIVLLIHDQASVGISAVARVSGESMQRDQCALLCQLKYGAARFSEAASLSPK
jgi:hypothetical protein